MSKDALFASKYKDFMREYETLGHMSKSDFQFNSEHFVIPHHGIFKRGTDKIRVVFDGSGRSSTDDRKYQLILWREDPSHDVQVYELNTNTYGLRSSPFIAIRTVLLLADDWEVSHPNSHAAHVMRRDIFVDDILTGADSVAEAQQLKQELIALTGSAGYELRKWSSNSRELLRDLPEEYCELPHSFDTEDKSFIKSLFSDGLNWDEPINQNQINQWDELTQDLNHLSHLQIPRCVSLPSAVSYSLHGFGDASELGYAASVYLRTVDASGHVKVSLVIAKSRVASHKTKQTIPKLELNASHLVSKLLNHVADSYDDSVQLDTINAWSDSSIVLSWLKAKPHMLQTFECNRVQDIQQSKRHITWRHVRSERNPSDVASRGMSARELIQFKLWWSPDWLLREESQWPQLPVTIPQELPGFKKLVHLVTPVESWEDALLSRVSSYSKLINVSAFILRFCKNIKLPREQRNLQSTLSLDEIRAATKHWIGKVQLDAFKEEIVMVKQGKLVCKSLQKLSVFVDDENLLRVGGRLRTKAVHLEVVSALTIEAFIASFTRFVSRRGLPSLVRSDRGTYIYIYKLKLLYKEHKINDPKTIDEFIKSGVTLRQFTSMNYRQLGETNDAALDFALVYKLNLSLHYTELLQILPYNSQKTSTVEQIATINNHRFPATLAISLVCLVKDLSSLTIQYNVSLLYTRNTQRENYKVARQPQWHNPAFLRKRNGGPRTVATVVLNGRVVEQVLESFRINNSSGESRLKKKNEFLNARFEKLYEPLGSKIIFILGVNTLIPHYAQDSTLESLATLRILL
ncbi:hypothetical protein MSG28_007980 [Choristoneura fumiferana]|uniref:Uncharacterized protein n=1 Tax=Choristoneura fumiferana TaxID=7141 RepID=A0ACC0J9G6_CHOFU|nr:hypothetical protein MSG28_007980 [Choristoneura fumiferana]